MRRCLLFGSLLTLALLTGGLGTHFLFTYLADGFSMHNIQSDLTADPRWECGDWDQEIEKKVDQPFSYLCRGSQCFVFESSDEKYILKLFRFNRLRPNSFLNALSCFSFGQNKIREKQRKLEDLFSSCKIAHDCLLLETKLIYLHLNKTNTLRKELRIRDRLGRNFCLNLDDYAFFIQEKVTPMYAFLNRCIEEDDLPLAKKGFASLISMLRNRCEKGIYDKDASLATNMGFTQEGDAVLLDIGQFQFEDSIKELETALLEVYKITSKFCSKMDPKYIRLSQYLSSEVDHLAYAYLIFSKLPCPFSPHSISKS